jgi:hypothetical protein
MEMIFLIKKYKIWLAPWASNEALNIPTYNISSLHYSFRTGSFRFLFHFIKKDHKHLAIISKQFGKRFLSASSNFHTQNFFGTIKLRSKIKSWGGRCVSEIAVLCADRVYTRNVLLNIHYKSYPIMTAEFNLRETISIALFNRNYISNHCCFI